MPRFSTTEAVNFQNLLADIVDTTEAEITVLPPAFIGAEDLAYELALDNGAIASFASYSSGTSIKAFRL